jgi:hypothetical protein
MNVDVTVPGNRDWFQVSVRDAEIRDDSVVVVSGCCLENGRPVHKNVAFFTSPVTPRGSAGILDIRVGVSSWNNKKVRLNIILYH